MIVSFGRVDYTRSVYTRIVLRTPISEARHRTRRRGRTIGGRRWGCAVGGRRWRRAEGGAEPAACRRWPRKRHEEDEGARPWVLMKDDRSWGRCVAQTCTRLEYGHRLGHPIHPWRRCCSPGRGARWGRAEGRWRRETYGRRRREMDRLLHTVQELKG
jgi:hypothetical protein